MAGSMRGVDDIHEWKNALTELRRSEVRPEDMEDKVFRILRFSYTRLDDWALQQCMLFCALFPEDHVINREELIELLIAEGVIKRLRSRQEDLDKGHSMLNKLFKVSLLEDGKTHIKMHDLIRDMVIQIMEERCPSITEAGRQLREVPEEKYWREGIVWVSLMKNDIRKIPFNFSPVCSTLSTLFLSDNKLYSIPDSFFLHFRGLKVLYLSHTWIKMLPKSIDCLENLKALSLKRCSNLYSMPSLGKLTSLEMLDLSFCEDLKQVPEGLELLSKLAFLNVFRSGINKLQSEMLTELSHLQFLAFFGKFPLCSDAVLEVEDEVVAKLKKLESLSWRFHNFRGYSKYVQLVSRTQRERQIINYFLYVGESSYIEFIPERPRRRELRLLGCKIDGELLLPKNLEILEMEYVTICNGSGLRLKTDSFEPELRYLEIEGCIGMEYLFHLSSSPSMLEILETLILSSLPELRALFAKDVEETPSSTEGLLPSATTFCSLRKIAIVECNNMKSLCSPRLFSNFHKLEEVNVTHCSEMEMIVASTEDETRCGHDHFNFTENFHFNLSKLRSFKLKKLPKLKRICSEQIVCDSLQKLSVRYCNELEKISLSLPLLSLQVLKIWTAEWCTSVQWGTPDQKSAFRPQFIVSQL